MKRFILSLIVVILLAACGPAGVTTPQQPLPTPAKDWTSIKMTHSGGIMGMLRVIEISRDGLMTVTDDRANKSISRQLSAEELTELSSLLAGFAYVTSDNPAICADCFIYTIEIARAGEATAFEANDITLAESGMEPLVTFLRALADQALE